MDLAAALKAERQDRFLRLRGGLPVPLALYGYAGADLKHWCFIALVGSGLIFPLAVLISRIVRIDFMKDGGALAGVIAPAFIGMLLFFFIAISALWTAPQLFPLILAVGMAMHWPVLGWMYGRTLLYSAHAVGRSLAVFVIWNWLPAQRLTLLPLTVSIAYLLTIAVILVQTRRGS
jgi:hypothetical protein